MPLFRKKPTEYVEAKLLTFENQAEVKQWCSGKTWSRPPMRAVSGILVPTLTGEVPASFGEYIVEENPGSFRVYRPELFKTIYESI